MNVKKLGIQKKFVVVGILILGLFGCGSNFNESAKIASNSSDSQIKMLVARCDTNFVVRTGSLWGQPPMNSVDFINCVVSQSNLGPEILQKISGRVNVYKSYKTPTERDREYPYLNDARYRSSKADLVLIEKTSASGSKSYSASKLAITGVGDICSAGSLCEVFFGIQ